MIEKVGDKCIGCGACASVCFNKCIEMKPNIEGFLYPSVDTNKCTNCGHCDRVCPVLYKGNMYDISHATIYGVRAKKEYREKIHKSASAGVFYFLSLIVLEKKGSVFGAVFDDNHIVKHICGNTLEDISRMQNSKYVQSDTTGIFAQIKDALEKDPERYILFVGTPCQCLGLKAFLGVEYRNLFIVDIVCHGVPSPLAFKKYLGYLESTKKEKTGDYQFRYKHKGWNYHGYMSSYVKFNNSYWPTVKDPYMSSFLKMSNYRESCYSCKYNTIQKSADLSLADFSGVREIAPEFYTKSGCSEVYINSEKGKNLFDLITAYIDIIPLDEKKLKGFNLILKRERVRPQIRDSIYKGINEFDDIKFVEENLMRCVSKKGILKFYLPYAVRKLLSTVMR